MYGFRKPFTASSYAEQAWLGIDVKTLLVAAQVLGYTVSKFIGIAVIAQMPRQRRATTLVALIAIAELALLGLPFVEAPWNALLLFLNGLPLGMVFGLVLGFLEGRRHTEAMTAGLCASFILADGAAKSLGAWLLAQGVTEAWMPGIAGLLALLPLLLCVALLARTPPPSAADVASRSERVPMPRAERIAFFRRYAPGLSALVAGYLLLTLVRSLRSDFAPELLRELGDPVAPSVFATSETIVAFGVLLVSGATVLVRDHRAAFRASIGIAIAGFACCFGALLGHHGGQLSGYAFLVLLGLGLYVPYVLVHTTVFERLVAMTRDRGNIGFLMYLADSFGYLGYDAVLLARGTLRGSGALLEFFVVTAWVVASLGMVCFAAAGWWLLRTTARERPSADRAAPPAGSVRAAPSPSR